MGFDVTTQRSLPLARTADAVVMARPRDFGFNEQTGLDNEFNRGPEARRPRSTAGPDASFRTWPIGSGRKGSRS